jgi:hypothetical protein
MMIFSRSARRIYIVWRKGILSGSEARAGKTLWAGNQTW